jgi:hypothetical protein
MRSCPHLLRALEVAGEKTPLRLLYGVSCGLEDLGEQPAVSSRQVLEFLELGPPHPDQYECLLFGMPSEIFEEDGIGFRLMRKFGRESSDSPNRLEFGQLEDDGAQMLDWLDSGQLSEWLERLQIPIPAARAFLEAERHTRPRVKSLEKLYQELHLCGSVALCYWHHQVEIPRFTGGFLPGPWPKLSKLRGIDLLLESLRQPRYLVDFAWAVAAYRDSARSEQPVLQNAAKLCRDLNVLPQPIHLGWSAANLIPHQERERLLRALRPEIFGRLPESSLSLKWGRLYADGSNLLAPEDPYHKAESLLGVGRVNRWIQRPEGRLRVQAEAGAVDRIEFIPN